MDEGTTEKGRSLRRQASLRTKDDLLGEDKVRKAGANADVIRVIATLAFQPEFNQVAYGALKEIDTWRKNRADKYGDGGGGERLTRIQALLELDDMLNPNNSNIASRTYEASRRIAKDGTLAKFAVKIFDEINEHSSKRGEEVKDSFYLHDSHVTVENIQKKLEVRGQLSSE